jgi:hypothetical protein
MNNKGINWVNIMQLVNHGVTEFRLSIKSKAHEQIEPVGDANESQYTKGYAFLENHEGRRPSKAHVKARVYNVVVNRNFLDGIYEVCLFIDEHVIDNFNPSSSFYRIKFSSTEVRLSTKSTVLHIIIAITQLRTE